MSSYTEEDLDAIFAKGIPQPGNDPNVWRKDRGGAWICRSKYGDTTPCGYGWEVDHIQPASKDGQDAYYNYQPLQWENNRNKSDNVGFKKVTSSGTKNIYCD